VRRNTKATVAVLIAVAAAAGALAASAGAKPRASATVKLMMLGSYQPAMDLLISNFKRVEPDIDVQATYAVAGPPYTNLLVPQMTGGNGPDVMWLNFARATNTSPASFAAAGYLADLTKSPWVKRLPPVDRAQVTYRKKVYGWSIGLLSTLISYDKTYFRQQNLKVPTTFAQLLGLCRQIAPSGKIPISWGAATSSVNTTNAVAIAAGTVLAKDPKWMAKRLAHKTTFASTPGWRRALQMILDMKDANCFGGGAAGTTLPQMAAQFAGGQAAMIFTASVLNGSAKAINKNLQVGMFPPPADRAADTRVTLQSAGYIGVNQKASSVAAAKTFVNFLAREKQSRLFAKVNYAIAPFDAQKGKLPAEYADLASYFKAGKTVDAMNADFPNTTMTVDMGTSIQGLFTGQKTVDQVLADLDTAFEKKG
jgi:raffinose/stachyose/melibiose transport system substrate-binding protein